MKLFFRLPGDDGKRKLSALSGKKGTIFQATIYLFSLSPPRRAVFFLPIVVSRWAKKEKPSATSVPPW
jgi:hypothetical protein